MDVPAKSRADERVRLIAARMEIDAETKLRLDAAIVRNLLVYLEKAHGAITSAITLGLYLPLQGEPDLTVLAELWPGFVALPCVVGPGLPLEYRRWEAGMELVDGPLGTREPADASAIEPRIVLAPCVGFYCNGPLHYRLGFGGGFFDRTLAARAMPAIGIAYEAARLDTFTPAAHDMPLTAIITENGALAG